jgi:hypothetical protein
MRRALANCATHAGAYDYSGNVVGAMMCGYSEDKIIREIIENDAQEAKAAYESRGFDFIPNPL